MAGLLDWLSGGTPGINPNPGYNGAPTGMLGYDPNAMRRQSLGMAIAQMGAGIANAPRGQGLGGGAAGFGQGMLQGQQMYRQKIQDQYTTQKMQRESAQQQAYDSIWGLPTASGQAPGAQASPTGYAPPGAQSPQPSTNPLATNLPPGVTAQMMQALGPDAGMALMIKNAGAGGHIATPQEEMTLMGSDVPGSVWVPNDKSAPTVMSGTAPPATPAEIQQYDLAVKQGYKGTILDYQLAKQKAGASSTTIMMPGDKKNDETTGAFYGGQLGNILTADFNAPVTIAKYKELGAYLDQVDTGKMTPTMQSLKQYAKSAGIDLESLGIKDDTAPAQAAAALSNEIALSLRNPAGGAGMPGAMSDADRKFLASMPPGIDKTPGANKLLLDYRVRLAKRDQDIGKLAREYAKTHDDRIDAGFFDALAQWSEAHPIFSDADRKAVGTGSGAAQNWVIRNGQLVPE